MNAMELPPSHPGFSEPELRWILAEAIKTSPVPLERLLSVLNENNIQQPAWTQMLLPHGRNLQSCQQAFETFRANPPPLFATRHLSNPPPLNKRKPDPDFLDTPTAPHPQKRRTSGPESVATRDILPKPPSNHGSPGFNPSQGPSQPKKRGRPSKLVLEQRQREAIARGEVILPKTLTPKPDKQMVGESAGGYAVNTPMVSSTTGPSQGTFESPIFGSSAESPVEVSSGKKKARAIRPSSRSKASKEPISPAVNPQLESEEKSKPPIRLEPATISQAEGSSTSRITQIAKSPAPASSAEEGKTLADI